MEGENVRPAADSEIEEEKCGSGVAKEEMPGLK